ncbi:MULTISPECIES: copper chaperone [Oxalobacteraceae]|jgi:Cu+-exporting ATPase|uniref:heavy-metal-associated domain-containing protein n=1 Tax=Oxalobacteraceae TaxID=75682 RepID=UPI0010A2FB7F|nr:MULTISPECIES: copper chaperone [Oxalobacteraceae]
MKSETLSLAGALDEAGALIVARVLNSVKGVSKVGIETAAAKINIDFDDDVTSLQELRTTLQQAGVTLKKVAHGEEGMCCGSCGG